MKKRMPKEGSLVKLQFSPDVQFLLMFSDYSEEKIIKYGLMVIKTKCVIFDTGPWDLIEFEFTGNEFEYSNINELVETIFVADTWEVVA